MNKQILKEKCVQASIIGCYRQGAWATEIANALGVNLEYVAYVIQLFKGEQAPVKKLLKPKDFFKTNKFKNHVNDNSTTS